MNGAQKPAALVVGAGIAGMQAALDIANAGFPVYLVERELGIGGRMAQLDKTFPTLDCASCIITPRLADVARHPRIQLLTYSELVTVSGAQGAFSATVRRKPRFVDVDRCVGCGLCAQVCPVSVPDAFNTNLAPQRAIHRLFAQVVPNAFGIHRAGRAPCRHACPAGQRIPGFIALIREGRYADAQRVLKLDNPFPGICGRICPHPCESACNRAAHDAPVNVRALKRFVADQASAAERVPVAPVEPLFAERVAIIGSGPAGLTAAQDLALAGYGVTVFEALPVAGGMLRVGVPAFRLPTAIVEREVRDILDLGVELRLNSRVEDAGALLGAGFAAVLVAVGAHQGVRLPLPGSDRPGVRLSTDFLRAVRLDQFDGAALGRVLVLGGGDVAVDCARTAVRLNAESVAIACLEGRHEMLAHADGIAAALAEGVRLHTGRSFKAIEGDAGRVTGVTCERVTAFAFDADGRLQLTTTPDSRHLIEADSVIFAVGQKPALDVCAGAGRTPRGTLAIDPDTSETSLPGLFAAGDVVSGTATAVAAVAAGHRAAYNIHQHLHGGGAQPLPAPWHTLTERDLPLAQKSAAELASVPVQPRHDLAQRAWSPPAPPFAEWEVPLTEAEALAEANRCLNCGICAECRQCVTVCEADAIDHNQQSRDEVLSVGAIILATGFDMYDPRRKPELGYGKYANVMHILEVERLLSASGPTAGKAQLPDGREPQDVVFIQCVGSRDRQDGTANCSRICCMVTAKQAHLLRDRLPEANITVFYIDIRAFGKGFETFHERVRGERIRYRRGNVSAVVAGADGRLLVQAEDTLLGRPVQLKADLVVLATALLPRHDTGRVAANLGLDVGADGFFRAARPKLDSGRGQVPGIFLAGACQGPKDILDTVAHAKAAAASALVTLAQGEAPC